MEKEGEREKERERRMEHGPGPMREMVVELLRAFDAAANLWSDFSRGNWRPLKPLSVLECGPSYAQFCENGKKQES